ncbi:LysR family transcriptional regulator [Paracoccus simplex]|uniref:LysR family transcriptional regulator n=1 Tax=Paracoccus simplex TaxID=2086346 RepID=A0ABV7RT10_9RHOB
MRFTLRQLSYFIAAGETLSVTKAAEQVNISQPSISAAISHLETELNVQLFIRHHAQGLSLTPAGMRLLRAAKESLRAAAGLYEVASDLNDRVSGSIKVGTFFTFAPLIAPELWAGFSRRYQDVQMTMTEGGEAELIESLRLARIDLALTYNLNMPPDVTFIELAQLRSYALVGAEHRFAGRGSIRLAELLDDPFILIDLPLTRDYFLGLFRQIGGVPHIVMETSSTASLRSYVAAGIGYGLMTARPVNQIAENGLPLVYLPLEDVSTPISFGIACLSEIRRSRVVEAFIAHCQEVIRDGSFPGMLPLDTPAVPAAEVLRTS